MKKALCLGFAAALATLGAAKADPVELKTYADADGWLNVQELTCAQLANTFQEDADYLTTWYSGWYNGLAKKHMLKVTRGKEVEHQVIVYCKAHQDKKIIHAIDVVFKEWREKNGIKE
jgi:hypothetical protein